MKEKRFTVIVAGRPSQGGWATERRSNDIRALWEFAKVPLENDDCTCVQFYDRGQPVGQWKPERFVRGQWEICSKGERWFWRLQEEVG